MKFAIDNLNKRIKPEFSGQKAICPFCNGILIGKCGEIYTWHWQHQANADCDKWKEHETEWHRTWKNKFPDSWQEVIINKGDEKHIADIRTPNGAIIEFQNSSISISTIRKREKFYKNMVWVLNAIEFKENFKIWSLVKAKKKEIETIYFDELRYLDKNIYQNKSSIKTDIEKKRKEIDIKRNETIYKTIKQKKLKDYYESLEELASSIIDKWLHRKQYYNSDLSEVINNLSVDYEELFGSETLKISKLKDEVDKVKKHLIRISELPTKQMNNKTYWVVEYDKISSTNFSKVKAILKETMNSLFLETIDFKNEFDFVYFHYYKDKYLFVIDLENDIMSCKSFISKNKKLIEELNDSIELYKTEVNKQFSELIEKNVYEINEEIKTLKENIHLLEREYDDLIRKETQELNSKREKIKAYKNQQKKKMNDNITYTMRKFKGYYGFQWKYERKSWQEANCPIYFDFGKEYLFEFVREQIFRKVDKKDFIKKFKTI